MSGKDLPDVIDAPEDGSDGAGGTPLLELGTLQLGEFAEAWALGLERKKTTLATDDKVRPPATVPSTDSFPGVRIREGVEELEPCCDDGFLERYVLRHESIVS